MALREVNFPHLLIPIINHQINIGMGSVPSMRGELFNVQTSNIAEEQGTGIGGMSPDAWDVFNKTNVKGRLMYGELFTQLYNHREYPVEIVIQNRLLRFDQYNQINSYLQRAGLSAATKKELDAVSLLNNAFNSNFTWSDGVALCTDQHPVSPNDATNKYSNAGTKPLNNANLTTARVDFMKTKDDKGNLIGLVPDELWVPPELEDKALEITNALNKPDTANNDANANTASRWTVKPWLRLDGPKRWFITSSVWRQQTFNWYDVVEMETLLVAETTTEFVYEVKLFYSYGVDDWRAISGQNPA